MFASTLSRMSSDAVGITLFQPPFGRQLIGSLPSLSIRHLVNGCCVKDVAGAVDSVAPAETGSIWIELNLRAGKVWVVGLGCGFDAFPLLTGGWRDGNSSCVESYRKELKHTLGRHFPPIRFPDFFDLITACFANYWAAFLISEAGKVRGRTAVQK